MRVGIRQLAYQNWGDACYEKMRAHGFSCVDYNIANTNIFPYDLSPHAAEMQLKAERTRVAQAGIEIYQMHGPWQWPLRDDTCEGRAERMEKMKFSIWAAAVLECKYWVVHPIMPYGIDEMNTEKAARTWDLNLRFMYELLQTAKPLGITICLENMPFTQFSMSSPQRILEFVHVMNDPNFKICLDTGHVIALNGISAGDAVRLLDREIRAFHVHDSISGQDLHLLPYCGRIDWDDFRCALRESHFDGAVCLETAPNRTLPSPLYEEMCRTLAKTIHYIVGN